MDIAKPYLLFLGDVKDQLAAKTAQGVVDWRPDWCVGQLRLEGCKADCGIADLTIAEAKAKGAKTMVVGVVNAGGVLPDHWVNRIVEALDNGLDVATGLHKRLRSIPEIAAAADRNGRKLHDVRYTDMTFATGKGTKRQGLRLLAVGTDCSVGKKYTTLALDKEMRARGMKSDFRATGQTGVLISGRGVAIDAVIADFIAGAAEWLSPANDPDHWDVIEGQGSLFHPSFAGVTLGLLHGAQPDAFVVCHEPTRTKMRGVEHPLPSIQDVIDRTIAEGRLTNPKIECVGIAINTENLDEKDALALLDRTGKEYGLPCVDPIRTGTGPIVDLVQKRYPRVTRRTLSLAHESWPIAGSFTISRGSKTQADVVVVTLTKGGVTGRGECVPYPRYDETVPQVMAALEAAREAIEEGLPRDQIAHHVAPKAAQNALDCALWDLEAKRAGLPAWQLAGLAEPRPVITAYTLSLDTPEAMAKAAAAASDRPLLKLKLGREGDEERIAAIRAAVPKARLIVDANEGWTEAVLASRLAACARAQIELVEQPMPAANDEALRSIDRQVVICADESAHDVHGIDDLIGKYDAINIKLDKTGGLTGALALAKVAREKHLKIMVGCMLATSLAMAPAMLIAQFADFVDLDGPLLLKEDRVPGISFVGSLMQPPPPALWG